MRKVLNGTITIYNFKELERGAQFRAVRHYYRFDVDESVKLREWKKIEEYFEGVEFYKDGTVYEEV